MIIVAVISLYNSKQNGLVEFLYPSLIYNQTMEF